MVWGHPGTTLDPPYTRSRSHQPTLQSGRLIHIACRRRFHAAEADDRCRARNELNDLVVRALELPGIPAGGLAEGVQVLEGIRPYSFASGVACGGR